MVQDQDYWALEVYLAVRLTSSLVMRFLRNITIFVLAINPRDTPSHLQAALVTYISSSLGIHPKGWGEVSTLLPVCFTAWHIRKHTPSQWVFVTLGSQALLRCLWLHIPVMSSSTVAIMHNTLIITAHVSLDFLLAVFVIILKSHFFTNK